MGEAFEQAIDNWKNREESANQQRAKSQEFKDRSQSLPEPRADKAEGEEAFDSLHEYLRS